MKLSTIIAITYVLVGFGGIAWFIETSYANSQRDHWPLLRRHGFKFDDLDFAVLCALLLLVFNAVMRALDIAKISKAPWVDFLGITLILGVAVFYVFRQPKNRSLKHAMFRIKLFFAPIFAAMAVDQYLDKAARFIAHLGF